MVDLAVRRDRGLRGAGGGEHSTAMGSVTDTVTVTAPSWGPMGDPDLWTTTRRVTPIR